MNMDMGREFKMQDLNRDIDQWIQENKSDMIQELKDWVAHPSVSRADLAQEGAPYGKDCREMLDFALKRGNDYGFRTANHQGYCGDIFYGDEPEELGLVCHLDVVPEGEGWIYEPYHAVEKDGFLIGRGVSDNKGAAIQALWALRFFRENALPLKKTLRLMLGCAEETGMADYKHYIGEQKGKVPSVSIVADVAFPVCYAQKGGYDASLLVPAGKDIVEFRAGKVRNSVPSTAELVLRNVSVEQAKEALGGQEGIEIAAKKSDEGTYVKITGHGKGGHAAFPEGTINAIRKVAAAVADSGLTEAADLGGLSVIAESFSSPYGSGLGIDFEDEESGKLTVNAGIIAKEGEHLKVDIDIRYPIHYTAEQIGAAITEKLKSKGVKITDIRTADPYYIDPNDEKVKTLTEIYHEVTGRKEQPYSMGGGTYSRVIPNAISYGPGIPGGRKPDFLPEGHGNAHGLDEALDIEEWLTGLKIYILTIQRLAG